MKSRNNSDTVKVIWNLVEPIAKIFGLRIWDVRFVKEGPSWYLRIFIDNDRGVTIDDCEKLSRAIDGPIEELDLIKDSYCLEVSSPGINRKLTREAHFKESIGKKIIIRLIRPTDKNQKELNGILMSYTNESITITTFNDTQIDILRKDIAFIKLDDFNI